MTLHNEDEPRSAPEGKQAAPQCCSGVTLVRALTWLTLGMLAALPLFGLWKYGSHGVEGLTATLIAFGICFASAAIALVVTHFSLGTPNAGASLLFSILIRTGVPLAAGMLLANSVGWLESVGILGLIMTYYLISLTLETAISVWMIRSRTTQNQLGAGA